MCHKNFKSGCFFSTIHFMVSQINKVHSPTIFCVVLGDLMGFGDASISSSDHTRRHIQNRELTKRRRRRQRRTLLSRAFLLPARFWRSRERLCINRVRSLLNMRCVLPGNSLEPKPNMPDLAAILVFHGTAGSIMTIGFVTKRTLALEKPV